MWAWCCCCGVGITIGVGVYKGRQVGGGAYGPWQAHVGKVCMAREKNLPFLEVLENVCCWKIGNGFMAVAVAI